MSGGEQLLCSEFCAADVASVYPLISGISGCSGGIESHADDYPKIGKRIGKKKIDVAVMVVKQGFD